MLQVKFKAKLRHRAGKNVQHKSLEVYYNTHGEQDDKLSQNKEASRLVYSTVRGGPNVQKGTIHKSGCSLEQNKCIVDFHEMITSP